MRSYTLKVPSSQKAEDWFYFIRSSLKQTEDVSQLIIDFNNVKFLDTDDFVVLACLIESFFIKGCAIKFIGGTDGFNNHLINIKFKEYWKDDFNRDKFTLSYN